MAYKIQRNKMFLILALGRLWQEEQGFEASLNNIASLRPA